MRFSKHIKFRKEKECIFICNCKTLIDFKVSLKYWIFLNNLEKGNINEKYLKKDEVLLLKDFQKIGFLIKK